MIKKQKFDVRAIALVGICAATIECGKLALAAIPNFEVVTLLTALYGYTFGWVGVLSAVVFVCIEPLIYGINTWVILYFIYWPLVAFVFMMLGHAKVKNRWILTGIAVALTVFFGVLSALIEVGLFSGSFDNFFYRFSVYYARGIVFYIIQIVTNAVLFPTLFPYLARKLEGLGNKLLKK
ncbi:MAG: hypothetical protein IJW03_01550 [Clostridia bacterium]|nr:hypothetical protein [Clostridia bacterium]